MRTLLIVLAMLPGALQEPGPWRIVCESGGKAWSVKEDGSDLRDEPGTTPTKGALSPDGRKRVTDHFDHVGFDIWVTDSDGKNANRLTNDLWFDESPCWTADGKRIVWKSMRNSNEWQIWIMDQDGRNSKELTSHPAGAVSPRVSPAGDRIAYLEQHKSREKLPPSTLRTMDLAGGDSKALIEKTQLLGHAWSPKGDRIAVSLVQELRILEVPSGKTVKSFKLEDVHKDLYAHAAYSMVWRPDGGAIACTINFLGGRMEGARVFGDDKIFVLPFEGKASIIEAGAPAGPVHWIRDKK